LKEQIISYPSLSEQQKIAAILLKIQKAIEIQESIIERAHELKKATMHQVFTHGLHGENTKETEIGRIPESWEVNSLSSFVQVVMGQSPEGENYNSSGMGIPLLNGPAEFTKKYPRPVQWTTTPTKVAKVGDILFCVRGNTVARMNIADQDYCIGRGIAAIRGVENQSLTEFIHYLIEYHASKIYSYATAGGSTFPNFSKADFDALRMQKPLFKEQADIAGMLQCIDLKIELHQSKKSALQDLFKTMLNKLVTGEIRVKDLDIALMENK
jgi:type I restriction enzyme S subunit